MYINFVSHNSLKELADFFILHTFHSEMFFNLIPLCLFFFKSATEFVFCVVFNMVVNYLEESSVPR